MSRVLGVANIGLVNFIDSFIHYFIYLSMLGIINIGIREIAANNDNKVNRSRVFNRLLALNSITTFIALVILIVCTFYIDKLREHYTLMIVGMIKLLFNYLLIEWFFKGIENFKYITYRTLVVRILYVVAIFIFVRNSQDTVIYYLITTMMIAINAIINCLYSRKFVTWSIKNISFKGLWKPFVILGIYAIITSMYTTFNVTFLGFVSNDTQVGYYTTGTKLFTIIMALFTAFTGVMMPRMSNLLSNNKVDEFNALLNKSVDVLIGLSVPLIFAVIVYAPEVIYIISGKGYEGAILPMRIIIPLVFIIGYEQIIVIQALMPLKQDSTILKNSVIAAIFSVILNILIVKTMLSVGSSIVWFLSEIIVLILSQIALKRLIKFRFPFKALLSTVVIYIPFLAIALLIHNVLREIVPSVSVIILLSLIYFIIVNVTIKRSTIIGMFIAKYYTSLKEKI